MPHNNQTIAEIHKFVVPILITAIGGCILYFANAISRDITQANRSQAESNARIAKIEADVAVIRSEITGKVEKFETVSRERERRIELLEARVTELEHR